jgi:hypothetical protein
MPPFTLPPEAPLPPPIDPVSIVLDIVGFILRALGFGSVNLKPLASAVNTTWTNLVFTSTFLYNTVRSIFDFLRKLLAILVDGLKHIISDILHGHLLNVLKDLQAMFHALQQLFKPIIDFLATLRGWYYKYIFRWIKAVEEILSRVRVILALFRILGAKWAAKLDADIARIQGYLATFNQAIVGTLNSITTWLTLAIDPAGVIRGGFFRDTLFSSVLDVRKAATFGDDRAFTASEAQHNADDKALITSPAGIATRNADGSVTLSDAAKRISDSANGALDYYGRAPVLH